MNYLVVLVVFVGDFVDDFDLSVFPQPMVAVEMAIMATNTINFFMGAPLSPEYLKKHNIPNLTSRCGVFVGEPPTVEMFYGILMRISNGLFPTISNNFKINLPGSQRLPIWGTLSGR